jgi:hypothetical protein
VAAAKAEDLPLYVAELQTVTMVHQVAIPMDKEEEEEPKVQEEMVAHHGLAYRQEVPQER